MITEPALVVVGVDGTIYGDAALAFAIEEADRGGDLLEVITVWNTAAAPGSLDPASGLVPSRAEFTGHGEAERAQNESLDRALVGRRRPPAIRTRVVRGDAGRVLVEAGRHGRLLVVGARPGSRPRAAFSDSVSRYCVKHFSGPLTIVPTLGR